MGVRLNKRVEGNNVRVPEERDLEVGSQGSAGEQADDGC